MRNEINPKVRKFYTPIWKDFSGVENEEALWLLFRRMSINNVPLDLFNGKTVLDVGCGSGRYAYALLKLGAKKVVGIDSTKGSVNRIEGFTHHQGNVLSLPFEDESFDFVFCNGVAHHTSNPVKALSECARVLKPGGGFWLMIYGKCPIYRLIDDVRLHTTPKMGKAFFEGCLELGVPRGKAMFLTDTFFVPEIHYFTVARARRELRKLGFVEVKYLSKGLDELDKYDAEMNLRFVATKAVKK